MLPRPTVLFPALLGLLLASQAVAAEGDGGNTRNRRETRNLRALRGQRQQNAATSEIDEFFDRQLDFDAAASEIDEFFDRQLQFNSQGPQPEICGMSRNQRARMILNQITASEVSKNRDLVRDRTPQSKALDWVVSQDGAQLCPDDPRVLQRYILAVFYYSTDGDNWAECSEGSMNFKRYGNDNNVERTNFGGGVIMGNHKETYVPADIANHITRGGGAVAKRKNDKDLPIWETNCIKVCRKRCCVENDGEERLCNMLSDKICRQECYDEEQCDKDEAKKELDRIKEEKRRKRENDGRKLQASPPCGQFGSSFQGRLSYLASGSECNWAGTSCNGLGQVTVVGFEQNNLGGTFPAEILALSQLRNLTLEGGRTSGNIPEEWGSGVWSGDNLQVLDLDQNRLTGTLNDNLFNLDSLKVLDIDENRLEGTLSGRVGNLVDLVFVEFEENRFEGRIPASFGNLKKLRTATFRGNDFRGEMPNTVCNNKVPNGLLNILTADCAGNKIECECCSSCF